ncbi:K02A2.6-like [Cordylochernes scorpioides]|uniref:K02A2.6-like n=1 Tax=Cordylochernes scorpioides TaxID=51811 RepID=A0ABY6KH92_9ARAC|nr:K02A2.6-like [Cordylochernes scorpioides]UYV67561.1 K02A2.6-like [Cordylochernes scorpioides]
MSEPVLAHFEEHLPTQLHNDASGYGIGAVLGQVHDGKKRPVGYASKTLTKAEKNYSTTERECLAVIWAINKFRLYFFVVLNPNIDIPKYDGTEDPRPWIESLEEIGFLYHWADYIISRYAAMNMTGSAKTWLNLHKASFTSWENIKIRLIQDFSLDANKEELRMKLNRMQH